MKLTEKEYLEVYKKHIEDFLGWGSSENWSGKDFENLSDLIFQKTGINLSISTLKRIWGKVKYNSIPTATTLDTLAQFSGYQNWRSFCSHIDSEKVNSEFHSPGPQISILPEVKNEPVKKRNFGKYLLTGSAITVVLVLALFWMSFFKNTPATVDKNKISFSSKNVADDLPNSVVFNYDIGKYKTDSVIIQQSWDPKRRETVPANQKQHTSIYYYPGFFKAKLLINREVVKEHEVYIATNGWKGIIQQQPLPVYLTKEEIELKGNEMKISADILQNKIGKPVFNEVWTSFYNVQEFKNVDAENFKLQTVLQNTSTKEQAICQNVKLTILGSNGVINLPLSGKGCTSAISVYLVDSTISGKSNDLSALGVEFLKPVAIDCIIKNKKIEIFLNKDLAFAAPIKSLGRIVGVIIGFEGTGEIRNFIIE